MTARRISFLLAFVLLASCNGDTGEFPYEAARAELLRETVDVVIVPGYSDVHTSATTLHARAIALCDGSPDVAGVDAARLAWRALFLAWEQTSAYQFGPTRDSNLGNQLAFAPTRPESIEANIASPAAIDDAWVDSLGAAGVGVFALEYLLYADADSAAVAAALIGAPRRCDYLVALGAHAERLSARIVAEWTPYGESFATAATAGNTSFPSQLRAISVLLTQMLSSVSALKVARLGVPLGDANGGVVQPAEVRSPYAGLSNEGMLAALDGFRATWTAGADGRGLGGYLAMRNAPLADTVIAQLVRTHTALAAIPAPLESYIVRPDHALATNAQLEVRNLERTIGTDVAGSLSISLMFTDADGD